MKHPRSSVSVRLLPIKTLLALPISGIQLPPLLFKPSYEQALQVQKVGARFGLSDAEHFLVCACDEVLDAELAHVAGEWLGICKRRSICKRRGI